MGPTDEALTELDHRLLLELMSGPAYGLELMDRIGMGQVYLALRKMERAGLLVTSWKSGNTYYELTEGGMTEARKMAS